MHSHTAAVVLSGNASTVRGGGTATSEAEGDSNLPCEVAKGSVHQFERGGVPLPGGATTTAVQQSRSSSRYASTCHTSLTSGHDPTAIIC